MEPPKNTTLMRIEFTYLIKPQRSGHISRSTGKKMTRLSFKVPDHRFVADFAKENIRRYKNVFLRGVWYKNVISCLLL